MRDAEIVLGIIHERGKQRLAWDIQSDLNEAPPQIYGSHTELEQRLLASQCELCGSTEDVQVHHVRALKDLRIGGRQEKPLWMRVMAARRRKTLVVCQSCHHAIHAGRLTTSTAANGTTLESRVL